jgi:hypothetical protein
MAEGTRTVSAERQQGQASTWSAFVCANDHRFTVEPTCLMGRTVKCPACGTITVKPTRERPFEERVRREERDRIVRTLREAAIREPSSVLRAAWEFMTQTAADREYWLNAAADFIESLPVSPGPEEGEQ